MKLINKIDRFDHPIKQKISPSTLFPINYSIMPVPMNRKCPKRQAGNRCWPGDMSIRTDRRTSRARDERNQKWLGSCVHGDRRSITIHAHSKIIINLCQH